jgi:hypothetical protein
MALPSAYLATVQKVPEILKAIQGAQAPGRFTQKFLEGLGFASTNDRLIINVLKALGFLSDTGEPQARYHQYLDASQSKKILAEGIREAYADLFQVNANAQTMTRGDVKNKMKTLSQGQYGDSVLDKMATTFKSLSDQADFSAANSGGDNSGSNEEEAPPPPGGNQHDSHSSSHLKMSGLVYNINIHLPESRDPAVYDALFRSLREHLS